MGELTQKYPGLFYHQVRDQKLMDKMTCVRLEYVSLAETVLDLCPESRALSLAMTHLEESLMRAIQSLALADPSALVDPREP